MASYGSFSRDVTELMSAMLVHIRVPSFSTEYTQTESAANEQGLKPNLDYYGQGWNNKLQNLIVICEVKSHCMVVWQSRCGINSQTPLLA